MERWETVERFRERLRRLIERSGSSQTAFAAEVGIDRSTLSQILSSSTGRLPRVETLAAMATTLDVSIDWLIGLSEEGGAAPTMMQVERGGRSPSDARLTRWRAEAAGYKIRYVPATLPDLLRIDAVIEHEFQQSPVATPEQLRVTREERLDFQRRPESDTEICSALDSLETFADGVGRWSRLSKATRRKQLAHMAQLTGELYPRFRWFLFDGLHRYSLPLTIFGPKRAVIYAGQMYLVFNGAEHIRLFSEHFDDLIRHAVVQPPDMVSFLNDLHARI